MLALDIPSLLDPNSNATPEHRSEVAHIKRFLEWWMADPAFRAALPADPAGVTRAAGLQADALAIRPLWEFDRQHLVHQQAPHPSVVRYRAFMREKLNHREQLQKRSSHHRGYQAWRNRQVQRCYGQLGPAKGDALVHAGAAIELCRGCSVGCWFCGISALKFDGVWEYTPENAALWQQIVETLGAQLGAPAGHGFCYWATDPLDNPEYERFCQDFAERLGHFPQTTTAQPMKDPARFRKIHAMARRYSHAIDRFSVLSLGMLKKVLAEYSAEELLCVEMVMQMDGAWASKAYAGRARSLTERWTKSAGHAPDPQDTSTIACVSGLLLRMPERSFEWITPCPADETWPNGYKVLARHQFADAQEFAAQLQATLARLPERLPLHHKLQLRPDLRVLPSEKGFSLEGLFYRHDFNAPEQLGQRLKAGGSDPTELALALEGQIPMPETLALLHNLFELGLLEETL